MTYKTLITLNKNALIYLARLIDNPDSFADNLTTSISRLKFKQPCPVWENRFYDVMVQGMSRDAWDGFPKTILVRYVLSYLCGTLYLDPSVSLKRIFAFSVGVFLAFQPMPP